MPANHTDLETRLWEAADELRANSKLKSSEYSVPVLGLIFLRYADHKFTQAKAKLTKQGSGRRTIGKADYQARGVLYLPEVARFSNLLQLPEGADIAKAINDAMKAIEADNDDLKDVLPKTYNKLDKELLVSLLKTFSQTSMDIEGDAFGKIYEYFLGKFAMSEGQKGGEFFTPKSIVKLIVQIIQPFHGRIYDPACGSGGMFVQSAAFVNQHKKAVTDISIYGQEKVAETIRLCKMNLAVHGLAGDIRQGVTYYEDNRHPTASVAFDIFDNLPLRCSIEDDVARITLAYLDPRLLLEFVKSVSLVNKRTELATKDRQVGWPNLCIAFPDAEVRRALCRLVNLPSLRDQGPASPSSRPDAELTGTEAMEEIIRRKLDFRYPEGKPLFQRWWDSLAGTLQQHLEISAEDFATWDDYLSSFLQYSFTSTDSARAMGILRTCQYQVFRRMLVNVSEERFWKLMALQQDVWRDIEDPVQLKKQVDEAQETQLRNVKFVFNSVFHVGEKRRPVENEYRDRHWSQCVYRGMSVTEIALRHKLSYDICDKAINHVRERRQTLVWAIRLWSCALNYPPVPVG